MSQGKEGIKSAGIIIAAAIASKILGFVREEAIAYRFGASYLSDAYYIASIIPLMLFSSVNGALRHTLIPIFVEYLHKKGKQEAFKFANNVFNVLTVILVIMVVAGYFCSPWLVKIVAPGFTGRTYTTAVDLTGKLIILILFLGLAGIASGILNSFKDFTIPAVTGLPQNIIIILAIIFLGKTMGITGLAIGTIIGVGSQLFLQFPALRRLGMTWSWDFDIRHPGLRKMGILVIPIFIGTSVNQINVLVDRVLASGLPEGSISALNFANRLSGLPLGLFIGAIATVLFPTMSEYATRKDTDKFKETIFNGVRMTLLLTVPIAVGLLILRVPIVQLLFQRGAFDHKDTLSTAYALAFYTMGIVAISLREIMNKAYFSLQDTTLPVVTGVIGLILNIILNLIFVRYLAHGGLALGTSVSAIVNVAIMFIWLPRKIGNLHYFRKLGPFLCKVLVAAAVMAVAVGFGDRLYPNDTVAPLGFQIFKVGGLILTGAVVYFVCAYLLRIKELQWAKEVLFKRLYKRGVYIIKAFPLDREIPNITSKLPLELVEVNLTNLRAYPNFRSAGVLAHWENMLGKGQKGYFAIYNGEVVNHSWVIINPSEKPLKADHVDIPGQCAFIHYCSTREDCRGSNVFPWVLTGIVAKLKAGNGAGLNCVYIDAEVKNVSSLKAIEKAGFTTYATVKNLQLAGMQYRKVRLMEEAENGKL